MNFNGIINGLKSTMTVANFKKGALLVSDWSKKHSAEICTGVGVLGCVTAVGSAVKATVDAKNAVEKAEEEKERHLTRKELIAIVWKYYILTALLTTSSVAGTLASNSIHKKAFAELAALLALSETKVSDLTAKIDEMFGEGTTDKVREEILKDKATEDSEGELKKASDGEIVICMNNGSRVKFLDEYGNAWYSTIPLVEEAIENLNYQFKNDAIGVFSVEDFVMMAGANPKLDDISIAACKHGWSRSAFYADEPITEECPIRIKLEPHINDVTKEVTVLVVYYDEPDRCYMEY